MATNILSPAGQRLVGLLASEPNRPFLPVEYAEKKLGIDRWRVVEEFQKLQDAGYGVFVIGRRGHPSRFVADADSKGLQSAVAQAGQGPASNSRAEIVLVINRASPLEIRLPIDLTRQEADRLARQIQAIPDN